MDYLFSLSSNPLIFQELILHFIEQQEKEPNQTCTPSSTPLSLPTHLLHKALQLVQLPLFSKGITKTLFPRENNLLLHLLASIFLNKVIISLSNMFFFFFKNKQQYINNKRHIKEAPQSIQEVYKRLPLKYVVGFDSFFRQHLKVSIFF